LAGVLGERAGEAFFFMRFYFLRLSMTALLPTA